VQGSRGLFHDSECSEHALDNTTILHYNHDGPRLVPLARTALLPDLLLQLDTYVRRFTSIVYCISEMYSRRTWFSPEQQYYNDKPNRS